MITLLLLLLLTACARAEGALAPTGVSAGSEGLPPRGEGNEQYLPDVLPASLEPIINYVDGLNLALTGEFLYLRSTAIPSCGCLAIANRLESLFKSASLIGGHYELKSIKLEKDGANQKIFLVTFGFGLATAFLLGAAVGLTPFFDAVMINWLSWVKTSTQVLSKH